MQFDTRTFFSILACGAVAGSAGLLIWLIVSDRKNRSYREPVYTVKFDADGFTISDDSGGLERMKWSEIHEVIAYKDDLFSYDEISLGFIYNETGNYKRVSEFATGYGELVIELEKHFPGIRTDWFREVAVPAFARNETSLWRSPSDKINTPIL